MQRISVVTVPYSSTSAALRAGSGSRILRPSVPSE
jgi:hypothetical protein